MRKIFSVVFALAYSCLTFILLSGLSSLIFSSISPIGFGISIILSLIASLIIFLFILRNGFKRRTIVICATILCLIMLTTIPFYIHYKYFTPKWDAIFYRYSNHGFNPVFKGTYWTEEDCQDKSRTIFDRKEVRVDDKPAEAFVCAKECSTDSLGPGSFTIDEIDCEEGYIPRPNSD